MLSCTTTTRGISIHALREEGDLWPRIMERPQRISIHALREEGDRRVDAGRQGVQGISIHALREEGDVSCARFNLRYALFLSTPSARRATICASRWISPCRFLSTPSARRATVLM